MKVKIIGESRISSHHHRNSSKGGLLLLLLLLSKVVMCRECTRIECNPKDLF